MYHDDARTPLPESPFIESFIHSDTVQVSTLAYYFSTDVLSRFVDRPWPLNFVA